MKTWNGKTEETDHKWYLVDASGLRLGRLATQVANILRGKNLPTFTPNADVGGFVVVINADKIEMTGNKWDTKKYYRHSRSGLRPEYRPRRYWRQSRLVGQRYSRLIHLHLDGLTRPFR